ncbi:MAG TPA: TPM domain-containing protein [Usitatibacter sp.]|nr:TPM domain-containing protein [Usitatibacter sp.]
MEMKRFWRHVLMSPLQARRAFPEAALDAVQREIAALEKTHSGEVCFVVEAELETAQLWRGLASRERAREVFALQGVWNTEQNNGVLIYLLLADRKVEIVADRGVDAKVGPQEWQRIVGAMEAHFGSGRFTEGALAGVREVSAILARHFPAAEGDRNELGDRPVLM